MRKYEKNRFGFFSTQMMDDPFFSNLPSFLDCEDKRRFCNCNMCLGLLKFAKLKLFPKLNIEKFENDLVEIAKFFGEYTKYRKQRDEISAQRMLVHPLNFINFPKELFLQFPVDRMMKSKLIAIKIKLEKMEEKMKRKVWDIDRNLKLSEKIEEVMKKQKLTIVFPKF